MALSETQPDETRSDQIHLVRGACPHDCPDTCATVTEVRDGRAVRFSADPEHPVTQGWLCAKVRPYLERVYHPDRLLYPLRRVGPKGGGPLGAHRLGRGDRRDRRPLAGDHRRVRRGGHPALLLQRHARPGPARRHQRAALEPHGRERAGALDLRRGGGAGGAERRYGARWAPDPRDVLHSRLILIWGHNPASTGPHFMPILREAQRRGAYVVVIDPRRTLTARSADRAHPAAPGDRRRAGAGPDARALRRGAARRALAGGEHRSAGASCASARRRIRRSACGGDHRPAGRDDRGAGAALRHDQARAAQVRRRRAAPRQRRPDGAGAGAACPPWSARSACAAAGSSTARAATSRWDAEAVGHASECPPTPRAVNMNRLGAALTGEVSDPPITSLYVFCANPVASAPNASLIVRGAAARGSLHRRPRAVHDRHRALRRYRAAGHQPARAGGSAQAYGHRHLQYNHAAIAPLGEAKSNWDVMRLLARAMGYDEPWLRQSAEEVIAEVLDATRATQSPAGRRHAGAAAGRGRRCRCTSRRETDVPFADGRFPTPSGKVELRCDAHDGATGWTRCRDYQPPAEFAGHATTPRRRWAAGADLRRVAPLRLQQPGECAECCWRRRASPTSRSIPLMPPRVASPTARRWTCAARVGGCGCAPA